MYWHLGPMKTGSTFLQKHVFPNASGINFLGWFGKQSVLPFANHHIQLIDRCLKSRNEAALEEIINELPPELLTDNCLYSNEGLLSCYSPLANLISLICRIDHSPVILLMTRNVKDSLVSNYCQYLRGEFIKQTTFQSPTEFFGAYGGRITDYNSGEFWQDIGKKYPKVTIKIELFERLSTTAKLWDDLIDIPVKLSDVREHQSSEVLRFMNRLKIYRKSKNLYWLKKPEKLMAHIGSCAENFLNE